MKQTTVHAGLCVGGPDWPYAELEGRDGAGRLAFLEELGETEATCVARCGGDYLRTLYGTSTFLGPEFHAALYALDRPAHEMTRAAFAERLHRIDRALDDALERLGSDRVEWSAMDAFLRGVDRCNATLREPEAAIHVLLCLVDFPPRPILEMPPHRSLPDFHKPANVLWNKYVHVHIALTRAIVQRYCGPGRGPVGAIEIVNEPDYHWIPDENRIERALRPATYPLGKYLTELHLSQIPESAGPCEPFFQEDGGYWVEQPLDPSLPAGDPSTPLPVLEFRWGRKFDRYVACAADLIEHVAFAARDEAHRAGVALTLVSGAVTHNNLDWLVRMHRANRKVFRFVDAIGLHPYHWPRHDMHDMDFVSRGGKRDWRSATPRSFAERYFKRFDFLEEIAALVKSSDQRKSHGMAGKSIWITEFGIPTKKAAHANAGLAANRRLFIYRRGEAVPKPIHAIVWEDKWDRFLKQVTPAWLRENRVAALLCYTMRAGGMGESTDEEHSNFTLFDLDCRTPRMERSTFTRLTTRFGELTGRDPDPAWFHDDPAARPARPPRPATWQDVDLDEIPKAPGMTDERELRYLHWACTGVRGLGAVVELGSFLGRTTVAMASGLARSAHPNTRLCSIDNHVWEPWGLEHYRHLAFAHLTPAQIAALPPDIVSPVPGSSFRPLFDVFTAPVQDNLIGISSELERFEWSGEGIEILFIDAAKSWSTFDRIVRQFFPSLIDGATVIHQDYKHFYTWWLHPVTERMIADRLLEPTEDIQGTPTQAFRFRRPATFEMTRYLRQAFDTDEIDALIERSRQRYAPAQAIAVAGARLRYLLEIGRPESARAILTETLQAGGFEDGYGLSDFLSIWPEATADLRNDVLAAARRAGAEASFVGARGVAMRVPRKDAPLELQLPRSTDKGAAVVVVQLQADPGNAAPLLVHEDPGTPRLLAPGQSTSLVLPADTATGVTTVRFTASREARLIVLAPVAITGTSVRGFEQPTG